MGIPQVVSPQEWRAARLDLLAREKEVTRAKDAVDAARRELPVTEVTTDYAFTYERGLDSLLGTYRWLELTPLGRQRHVTGFPHHDAYGGDRS
jgi:predicted dithiol-disulfide oxidoreductase (DUF899 family)